MSTKEYGCFFCDGKSAVNEGNCPKCDKPINVEKLLLKVNIANRYKPVRIIGRGFYGWTVKMTDGLQDFAVKILPKNRVRLSELEDKEARALAACSPHRNIARFFQPVRDSISLLGVSIEVYCLVFEYIDKAESLNRFLRSNKYMLTKVDIIDILVGIVSGLNRLHSINYWHYDLHDDNILIRPVDGEIENLQEKYEAKLIDFGSVKPKIKDDPEPEAAKSDYAYLAKHACNLVSRYAFLNMNNLVHIDHAFAKRINALAQRLSDPNISRRDLTPEKLRKELNDILTTSLTAEDYPTFKEMIERTQVSISEPFENRDALYLTSQDIALLFRDSLDWQGQIQKSEPVLVVGPRGCGKTMLLRYLSTPSQGRPQPFELTPELVASRVDKLDFVGFMLRSCDIRTPFDRSSFKRMPNEDTHLAEDYCREYINTKFVHETVCALSWLHTEKLATITPEDINIFASKVHSLIRADFPEIANLRKSVNIIDFLGKRVIHLSNISISEEYKPTFLSRDDVLHHLALGLKSMRWIQGKDIYFLLDDYTLTILPEIAMKAFNTVLFRKSEQYKIKISSEGEGPIFLDTLGRLYKEGRDFVRINLGEIYFERSEEDGRLFIESILDARFKATKIGSLKRLKSTLRVHKSGHDFGRYLRSMKRPGDARFYGFDIICRLCSGDVSYVIELLGNIMRGRWDDESQTISIKEQDTKIKEYAQRQLVSLRTFSINGPKLHDIAINVGDLIKSYLYNSNSPDERLRIEIEGEGSLSPEAEQIHLELLKHSVLIPGGGGKSRKGLPTKKYFFRRLYAPCFPFSPNRGECIALTWSCYEKWLLEPSFIKKYLKNIPHNEQVNLI